MVLTKKSISYLLLISIFCLSPLNYIFARMESTNFIIYGDVFSSGGSEDSTSANFGIQDTIGEGLALSSTSTSSSFGIKTGFREMYADSFVTLSLSSGSLNLGALSTTETKFGSHTMTVETDSPNGFTVTLSGDPLSLSGGVSQIDASGATAQPSVIGTKQFGINLVANTTPAVGADPAGLAPIGSAANQYRETNKFAFLSGATVATSSAPINSTIYTVSYIANISSDAIDGSYDTILTYGATVNY